MTKTTDKKENDIFPETISPSSKERLLRLAETIFQKDKSNLTRKDISMLIEMDMKTTINKLNVGCSSTRPTDIKFATNNYHASMEIDLSGVTTVIRNYLETVSDDKLIDEYFDKKNAIYNMIRMKYESTENYLRSLLNDAMAMDNCPVIKRKET